MIPLPVMSLSTVFPVSARQGGLILAIDTPALLLDGDLVTAQHSGSNLHPLQRPTSTGTDRLAIAISHCLIANVGGGNTSYTVPSGYTQRTPTSVAENRICVGTLAITSVGQIASGDFTHDSFSDHAGGEGCFLLQNASVRAAGSTVYVTSDDELTVTAPAGTQIGDFMLAIIMHRSDVGQNAGSIVFSDGWRRFLPPFKTIITAGGQADQYCSVMFRQAISGDPGGNFTFRMFDLT